MMRNTGDSIIQQKNLFFFLSFTFFFHLYNQNIRSSISVIYFWSDIRHYGIWRGIFFMSKTVQHVCQNDRSKMIFQINEVCSASCQRISCSWHLLGLTDALLGCLCRLLSESDRLTSRPRIWLAVEIESDGNWLHITCLKKVSSQWGIKKSLRAEKTWPSIFVAEALFKVSSLPAGTRRRGVGVGVGQNRNEWQEEGRSWQLNRADG